MEEVIAIAIGVLAASGVWLILRPRTFQVVMGLCLLSYGVNLFIFSMGSLFIGKEPIIKDGVPQDLLNYTDPLPQALVLTAIVISFAMTALFLVVLLASRGLTGTELDAQYWARNLREPVHFSQAVQHFSGCLFLEISPHPILLHSIEDTLRELSKDGATIASLRRHEPERDG